MEPTALLSDADLDAATQIQALDEGAAFSAAPKPDASLASQNADRSRTAPLLGTALASLSSQGLARGQQDLGGWLAYVEQRGKNYSIRLVDLNDANQPERRGDYTVYSGSRAVQSVAVSRDGTLVAFTAQPKDGDFDLYLLDVQRNKASTTRTPEQDEGNVSMSLWGEALAWYHDAFGGYYEFDAAAWKGIVGIPMATAQPSISGDGLNIIIVEQSGTLAYTGTKVLFKELFSGVPYLTLYDLDNGRFVELVTGVVVDHPYLTADGTHATFSTASDAVLVDLTAGTVTPLSPDPDSVDTATYWARGNFTSYSSVNDQGTFVRPDEGVLNAAGRTVPYHVQEFRPISDDFYAIESTQEYDGYLNLCVDNFNPKKPDQKLLASNDDHQHAWSQQTGGKSRIVAPLQRNKTYHIVTSACGAPGTPCGPSQGKFTNLISDGATQPPYTQLPAPDNTGFNITLRF